jgi:hypothetical protein
MRIGRNSLCESRCLGDADVQERIMNGHRGAVHKAKSFEAKERRPFRIGKVESIRFVDNREIQQAMSRHATLGRHGFCKTAKIGRRTPKSRRRYESSKPLPPREQAVADQNLDCPRDRKPADPEPPRELRLTLNTGAGLPDQNVLSEPIEELEVQGPVEAGSKSSYGGHVTQSYG